MSLGTGKKGGTPLGRDGESKRKKQLLRMVRRKGEVPAFKGSVS